MNEGSAIMDSAIPMEHHDDIHSPRQQRKPNLRLEEAVDHLRSMLFQEQRNYRSPEEYLLHRNPSDGSDRVNDVWRKMICEWIFEVVDHFSFDREVVSIALDYLDRSVSRVSASSDTPISKREFQLFAVASVYLAVKLHGETDGKDGRRLKLKVSAFEELSRGFFKVETIEAMECRILSLLNWHVNPPTANQYISYFIRLLPEWTPEHDVITAPDRFASRLLDVSKYLSELACFDSRTTFEATPSVVAYASLLCAIESMNRTTPIPHHIHNSFLRNITKATKVLSPHSPQITRIRAVLRALCPDMFETDIPRLTRVVSLLDNEAAGHEVRADQQSPISVFDTQGPQRKRPRTSGSP